MSQVPALLQTKDGLFLSGLSSVVYEHRSRLEKSLQKERLEHKKAKEGEEHPAAAPETQLLFSRAFAPTAAFSPFRLSVLQVGSSAVTQQGEGSCPPSANLANPAAFLTTVCFCSHSRTPSAG